MKMTLREKDNSIQAIVSYKLNGKWRQKSKQGFKTQKEAKRWAENMMYELKKDERDNITGGDITLQELIDEYIEYTSHNVRENTIYSQTSNLRNFALKAEKIINKPIKDIRPVDISNVFFTMKEESGNTYYALSRIVRAVFNFAVKELRAIRENPVKPMKKENMDQRIKYIDKEMYMKILEKASSKKEYEVMIKLLYNTGVRWREALGLTTTNIFEDYILIDKQWDRTGKFSECKNKNGIRKIPITKELRDELLSLPLIDLNGRIFNASMKGVRTILSDFKVSPHCFRHTFATNLVMMGANLKIASEIVGDSFDVFIKVYVHSSEDERQNTFDLVRSTRIA